MAKKSTKAVRGVYVTGKNEIRKVVINARIENNQNTAYLTRGELSAAQRKLMARIHAVLIESGFHPADIKFHATKQ